MQTEGSFILPNIKWKIMEEDKAAEYGLHLIDLNEDNTLLSINVKMIPEGWTLQKFIEIIQETGIVIIDKK